MIGAGRGKMPTGRGGRERILQPGDLAVETQHKIRQRQCAKPASEPIAPSVLPSQSGISPPPSEPTADEVTMISTLGYMPYRQFECGVTSYSMVHEPILQQPPYEKVNRDEEEQKGGEEEQDGHTPHRQRRSRLHQRDADREGHHTSCWERVHSSRSCC